MSYTLFSMTDRKAAKRHRCIWCGEHIEPGDTYSDERSVYDGEIQRMRWHPECRADAERGWQNGADSEFHPHENERPRNEIAADLLGCKGKTRDERADQVRQRANGMTPEERRVAHGTTTIADSSLVIEMANRLIRYTPATERDKT